MLTDLSERKALTSDEVKGLFQVIRDYSYGLSVLDDYDHGRIAVKTATKKEFYQLTAVNLIEQMKKQFGASGLFGKEKDESFKSSLGAIYQILLRGEISYRRKIFKNCQPKARERMASI
ncbi:MAG TPA: hypothetical protein DD723_06190 [Candidatus Omnitrophica bacterium]|nr:MAG: hypothetical protein A2Z81_06585 [Omnitrophica WOR_2 bacterium GWA2_45_18]OGX21265.1 MAG: hypothetical protein A2Y04_02520 [Omnitrophica WOR_2 bacterium GWC2_45_7]HBR15115.1 hypothetical protein [Candidatus Omnitrophota bacterium]